MDTLVDTKELNIVIIIHLSLMNNLQLCTTTLSSQNMFAQPPVSFKVFCLTLNKQLEALFHNVLLHGVSRNRLLIDLNHGQDFDDKKSQKS